MTKTPAVLAGLTKRYGSVTAVDDLNLTINPGEVVALLGPNGAGKSTTIDMMLGLTRPDAGDVQLYGKPPADAIRAGSVGAMLQSGGLLPDLTVREIVVASRLVAPAPAPGQPGAGPSGHQRSRPAPSGSSSPAASSNGYGSRSPSWPIQISIVLDEPTTGLDVEARRAFWASMREETARGRTVLFATHYLDEADAFADRIVLLRSGRVVADGTAAQIKSVVTGRHIRATLADADPSALAALPGVDSVELRGETVLLASRDSDATLRALLDTTTARDIEVTAQNLEDAFIALTVGEPA